MSGAGTDYCILLIQRFREEMSHDGDKVEALARTVRSVGKTVAFSASTVFVAFFLIGFAQFGLYQSAVGVAIGVAVTLIAGLTLTPALLLIFGKANVLADADRERPRSTANPSYGAPWLRSPRAGPSRSSSWRVSCLRR